MAENMREIYGHQAVNEALDLSLEKHKDVVLIGQGVPDGTQTYGTTTGLSDKYGDRVYEMPLSEAGMTGIMMGAALTGLRPVMTFARFEFALLAMDQIVNQAAKWSYMFDGQAHVPLTMRLIIGRGWGQGAQHSQSLHNWFAHIPGLKVVMPSTPRDLKGLLISSIEDPNPVIFVEHRWLHYNFGPAPEGYYTTSIGKSDFLLRGNMATVVASSYMSFEALKACQNLAQEGIEVELIDLKTIAPLDDSLILESVKKTGRLIVCDQSHFTGNFAGEIIARVCEKALEDLKEPPIRITYPDIPLPTTKGLANFYFPTVQHIENAVKKTLGIKVDEPFHAMKAEDFIDIPDKTFKGPF
ncbi:MAG TPA: alpha-ketoacid dehydrogenase subunit beta [Holosporales bacterium]|nr:alpha-ketoacid dehydrogenase subunit beta [Holosporales bacterium]